jgi:hypothetical protein
MSIAYESQITLNVRRMSQKEKKMKKRILVLVAMLALVPATTFAAAPEGSVTGTFSNNSPPSITSVTLWDTADTPAEASDMTPQVKYDARVVVTDADGLTDLNTVVVKVWHDSNGGNPTEAEFNDITAGNAQTAIIITWTEGDTFVLAEETGSSWDMTVSDCVAPANLPGTFQFKFTVGKVATETSGLAKWQIAAMVTDDAVPAQTAFNYDTTPGATMNWYGEITVPGATTVNWGAVNPGMNFAEDISSEQALGVTIKYISNGAFDEKVKSGATWTGVPSGTATLDADGSCTVDSHFALKAADTGTLPTDSNGLVDAINGVTIDDTGTQTLEAGHEVSTNTLWLKLASTFTKATYSGTITYIIADGT